MTRRDPSLQAGDLFQNQFEIRELLGSGGHAFVYRALDQIMGREVALKLIEIPTGSASDRRRRARLEAQVLSKLNHANIVRVFGAGATDDGWIYLIMEVLEGRSLREALQQYRELRVGEALLIGAQIADGVHAAHLAKTVHRDLKPENVFLERGNQVRVIDFGVAKFEAPEAQTTQRDLIQGTLYYMSPEHLQGVGVTARSDVFALGVTLYELLAGVRPALVGLQEVNPNAVIYQQINRMPPALNELRPDIPAFVGRTIQRMLAKNPVDRWQGMDEVAAILRDHLGRWRAEVGPAVSPIRDLSRPPAREAVDAGDAAPQDTEREAPLAVAVTRPLTSPAVVPEVALPSPTTRDANLRFISRASSPVWSVRNEPQRPLRRAVGARVALGAVVGVALGLTALSLRQHSERSPVAADSTPMTASGATPKLPGATQGLAAPLPAPASASPSPDAPSEADNTPTPSSASASSANAAPPASASQANWVATRDEQAGLPASGLGEPRAARTRRAPRSRPKPPPALVPQFGPEDIR